MRSLQKRSEVKIFKNKKVRSKKRFCKNHDFSRFVVSNLSKNLQQLCWIYHRISNEHCCRFLVKFETKNHVFAKSFLLLTFLFENILIRDFFVATGELFPVSFWQWWLLTWVLKSESSWVCSTPSLKRNQSIADRGMIYHLLRIDTRTGEIEVHVPISWNWMKHSLFDLCLPPLF